MYQNNFMRATDVAKELSISESHAYKIIRKFNNELEAKGFFIIAGRINRQYFLERTCYGYQSEKEEA